ncbi:MAG: right-handed parallel beta-helix repeat-containing protein [Methyloceanibacter sp.]
MTGPRLLSAADGIEPDGETDQTTLLQRAADEAARSGTPLFLPAGVYATGRLILKSGTHIEGVPGQTVLRYRGGGAILSVAQADTVRLSGLELDGGNLPLGDGGALLAACDARNLDIIACRFIASSEDGIVLRRASGRIAGCEVGTIGKTGLAVEDCGNLTIAGNLIEKAATGLSLTGSHPNAQPVVVQNNFIRDLFLRKTIQNSGTGIAVAGDCVVRGNLIDGAPAYGILIAGNGQRARVSGNAIRDAYIDIAMLNEPLSRSGSAAFGA